MTTFLDVLVEEVVPHPHNVRRLVEADDELVYSIRAKGVLQAVTIAPVIDGQFDVDGVDVRTQAAYVLIAGHRRYDGALKAGLATIPAIVRDDLDTEPAQVEAMLVENLHRSDLTPVEEADAYRQLTLAGVTTAQIANRTGRSKATVASRLKLAKIPDTARDLLHGGQMTLGDADALASFAGDKTVLAELTTAIGTAQWDWKLGGAVRKREGEQTRKRTLKQFERDGVKVATAAQVDRCYEIGVEQLVDAKTGRPVKKSHGDCKGHRGYADPYDGRPKYLCTSPKRYGHIGQYEHQQSQRAAAVSDEQRAEEENRRQVADQLNERMDARRDVVIAALSKPLDPKATPPPHPAVDELALNLAGWAAARFAHRSLDANDLNGAAVAIGVLQDNPDRTVEQLIDEVRLLRDEQATRIVLTARLLQQLEQLHVPTYRTWAEVWRNQRSTLTVDWLSAHGYELADVETEVLTGLLDPTPQPDADRSAEDQAAGVA